jgi:hypothetical protein
MTSGSRRRRPVKRARSTRSDGDSVGYGRPPKRHQFKPGRSGNPKGRPKGRKNEATLLAELLHRKVTVNSGGEPKKITILEAILLRITEDSLRGNTRSAAFLLNRLSGEVEADSDVAELGEDDRSILAAFAERIKHKRK